jgi:hypothetical protein
MELPAAKLKAKPEPLSGFEYAQSFDLRYQMNRFHVTRASSLESWINHKNYRTGSRSITTRCRGNFLGTATYDYFEKEAVRFHGAYMSALVDGQENPKIDARRLTFGTTYLIDLQDKEVSVMV